MLPCSLHLVLVDKHRRWANGKMSTQSETEGYGGLIGVWGHLEGLLCRALGVGCSHGTADLQHRCELVSQAHWGRPAQLGQVAVGISESLQLGSAGKRCCHLSLPPVGHCSPAKGKSLLVATRVFR